MPRGGDKGQGCQGSQQCQSNLFETPIQGALGGNDLKESSKNWKWYCIIDPCMGSIFDVSKLSNTGISHGRRREQGMRAIESSAEALGKDLVVQDQ